MSEVNNGVSGDGRIGDSELLEYAPLVALDALDDVERARVLRAVEAAAPAVRAAFDAEVADVRETLTQLSAATATAPPPELRSRVLDRLTDAPGGEPGPPARASRVGFRRPQLAAAAAAAVLAIGGGAVIGYAIADRTEPVPSSPAEQIFASPDVRTVSGDVAGGHATVTYSPSSGEGLLVMNDVPRPAPGTIYQMWLVGPDGSRLAGTMSDADVSTSTTALITDMSGATAVKFTVGDAATPDTMTGDAVAELPLGD